MSRPSPYPAELRRRAVRMVAEVRLNYESDWAAITAVAQKLGIGTAETLRKWVRQAQVDGGQRAGVSTDESAELKRLRRENAELRRANEILKSASAFSRPSSTGHSNARDLHRRAQTPVRRRADLPRPDAVRVADRVQHLPRRVPAVAVGEGPPRCLVVRADSPGPRRRLRCLRGSEGVAGLEPRRRRGGPARKRWR
jgi:transposase